jgi:alginate O-acetyltransferase complex protein AlgI
MAIGVARIFGFRLPENFNYPYISQTITEFWRRWHITLSNWFRDYVYFPLERSHRKTTFDRYTNIIIVFLLTGLWHGASWNFVFWGLAQGLFIVFERSRAGAWVGRAWRPLRHGYALLAIMFSWILFRFGTLESAFGYIGKMLGLGIEPIHTYPQMFLTPEAVLALALAVLFSLPVYPAWLRLQERLQAGDAPRSPWANLLNGLSNGTAILLLALSMIYLAGSTVNAFIYFRF